MERARNKLHAWVNVTTNSKKINFHRQKFMFQKFVGLQVGNIAVKVASIYRPPRLSKTDFLESLPTCSRPSAPVQAGGSSSAVTLTCRARMLLISTNDLPPCSTSMDTNNNTWHSRRDTTLVSSRSDVTICLTWSLRQLHSRRRWSPVSIYLTPMVRPITISLSATYRWCSTSRRPPATPTVTLRKST